MNADGAKILADLGRYDGAGCGRWLFLIGGRGSGGVHADSGVRTETAAAAAGATVQPTDPPLRVEPK
jgi:hypothetical protein